MDRVAPIILLRLRLAFRGSRSAGQGAGTFLLLFFFIIPLGVCGGAFASSGLNQLSGEQRADWLHMLLANAWLFWLSFPIFGFSLNQSCDLTKLFIYPVRRTTIFLANALGCVVDPTTFIIIPAFAVIAYHHATSAPAGVVAVLALALFMIHTIALSQAFLWALLSILRSRRMSDWAVLLAPLAGVILYFIPIAIVSRGDLFEILVRWRPSDYIGFTPPGVAARAIAAAEHGQWLPAALYLAACLAYAAIAVALGAWVLARLHGGEVGRSLAKSRPRTRAARVPLLERLATTPLRAMAVKEARYYWRDTHHRLMFILPLLV
ncbi:MAG TPA: hypothetical protein QGH10_23770, partial [Armatimonadota bacterium]|nr:hypothetical protein [Armatimonadota bacterium]